VLVAVLVLAVGVLGGAAMQLTALRARHDSSLLSHAVQLAASMAERMRANSGQMALPDGANPYLGIDFDSGDGALPSAPATLCFGVGQCDGAQLARLDLYQVQEQVAALLPGGRLTICRDSNVWDTGSGSLRWDCDSNPAAPVVIRIGWRRKDTDGGRGAPGGSRQPAVALALAGVVP
jgi:type IV pilus assembly protein PilV